MSSAGIQKLFCGIYSTFKCSFDEFVGEKVFSPSYSSAILAPPHKQILKMENAWLGGTGISSTNQGQDKACKRSNQQSLQGDLIPGYRWPSRFKPQIQIIKRWHQTEYRFLEEANLSIQLQEMLTISRRVKCLSFRVHFQTHLWKQLIGIQLHRQKAEPKDILFTGNIKRN